MTWSKRYLDAVYALQDGAATAEVRGLYDAWAASYDQEVAVENGYAMPARVAAALAKLLADPAADILDIGCGTGLSGRALAEAGFKTIDGCDISLPMLEKAAASGAYRRLFTADLMQPPIDIADGSYDATTLVGVFHYGHVRSAALGEILRLVRPGGMVALTVSDHYLGDSDLKETMEALVRDGVVSQLLADHGIHTAGRQSMGWVFVLRKG